MRLILTGTSGHLGSRVLQTILHNDLIPAADLVISTSSPHKVQAVAKQNDIEIIPGDFTDPSALRNSYASANADILFLVSYPSPSIDRWLHHKTAIDAAKDAGVKLIVYTSLMFGGETGMDSVAGVQQAHIKTVKYLQTTGLEYVVLREGIYAESWWLYAGFLPQPLPDGDATFVIPSDGKIAWVSWDDLGEATAHILAKLAEGQREWVGRTLNLTGPRATTISEIGKLLAKTSKRKVDVNIAGPEEAKRYHLRDGKKEEWLVESWVGWFTGISAGECEVVDPLLEQVLGRASKGIEECAEQLFSPSDDSVRAWH